MVKRERNGILFLRPMFFPPCYLHGGLLCAACTCCKMLPRTAPLKERMLSLEGFDSFNAFLACILVGNWCRIGAFGA